jgi:hypothetical protein
LELGSLATRQVLRRRRRQRLRRLGFLNLLQGRRPSSELSLVDLSAGDGWMNAILFTSLGLIRCH